MRGRVSKMAVCLIWSRHWHDRWWNCGFRSCQHCLLLLIFMWLLILCLAIIEPEPEDSDQKYLHWFLWEITVLHKGIWIKSATMGLKLSLEFQVCVGTMHHHVFTWSLTLSPLIVTNCALHPIHWQKPDLHLGFKTFMEAQTNIGAFEFFMDPTTPHSTFYVVKAVPWHMRWRVKYDLQSELPALFLTKLFKVCLMSII